MKYLKKFEAFVSGPQTSPSVNPGIAEPGIAPAPTKPQRPVKPSKPITRPAVDPDPKATAEDVAKRFIKEVKAKGESVEKYLKKNK